MKVDLHVHTKASDGEYSPREIVQMAKELELSAIGITDHDTVSGVKEAMLAGKEYGVKVIPGIEISTMDSEEIHLVGLSIDAENSELVGACNQFETDRLGRGKRVCEFLAKQGIEVDWQEVIEIAGGGSVGRPHFAEYLQQHGYVKDRNAAFEKYLNTKAFHHATDRKLPSTEEAIQLVHRAGGLAVLAHPGLLKAGGWELEELLKRLVEAGLDGIEVIYSRHNSKQVQTFTKLAEKYHLRISAGSDFHGEHLKADVKLGMELLDEKLCNMFILKDKI